MVMRAKPLLLFRKQKKTALLAVVLVSALLAVCGVRLYEQRKQDMESVETMTGVGGEHGPQSLFGLLEQLVDKSGS